MSNTTPWVAVCPKCADHRTQLCIVFYRQEDDTYYVQEDCTCDRCGYAHKCGQTVKPAAGLKNY